MTSRTRTRVLAALAVLVVLLGPAIVASTASAATHATTFTDGDTDETETGVSDTGQILTNTTSPTNTTENTVSTLTETTNDTTSSVGDSNPTVGNTTSTVEDTTSAIENSTSILDDTTSNVTDATNDIGDETTEQVNASIGVKVGTTHTPHQTTETTPTASGTGLTPASGTSSGENRNSGTERDSETTAAPMDPAGSDGAGPNASSADGAGNGMPAVPGGRETAVIGALAVAGVAAAAGSKQVAAAGFVTPPTELRVAGHAVRAQAIDVAGTARARLGRLPRLILPFGYSQCDDSDPLEHDVRRALFEHVEYDPGVNLSTLAEEREVSRSTVRHHLRILSKENLVESERIRGKRRYFPQNESASVLVAALDDEATASILQTLARSGSSTVSDLADALGRDPSTISHHLSRLEDDDLIERERDGQAVMNRLTPVATRALASEADRRRMATD